MPFGEHMPIQGLNTIGEHTPIQEQIKCHWRAHADSGTKYHWRATDSGTRIGVYFIVRSSIGPIKYHM